MTRTKMLLETLRLANGGKVVCDMQTPNGERLTSIIEQSFFEEFSSTPAALNPKRQLQIIQDNTGYLESEAERLWNAGQRELVIR
ncbi:MAG: hypothetical protein ACK5VJ_00795 [Pseudomonadota bacterium]|jgi:hypothetical protein